MPRRPNARKLFRQYVEQQQYGGLLPLIALAFVVAIILWGEFLR
jgi:hypothetical protein